MVVFIKSAISHIDRRNFIRKTWASIRYTIKARFLYIFLVGKPISDESFTVIMKESNKYKDMLIYDGPDDYRLVYNVVILLNINCFVYKYSNLQVI